VEFRRHAGWYVPLALEARRALSVSCAGALALGLASCGGGNERQDKNEPSGTFHVQVVKAEFPARQSLAKRSRLEIVVRNTDNKTVPNVAVTLHGFSTRSQQRGLADPSRPTFVINGVPKELGGFPEAKEAGPEGGETAFVDTWALGPVKPGYQKSFRWSVTAVKAGPYRLRYEISAGLDGKAKAVDEAGTQPSGLFVGTVSNAAPNVRVDPVDGTTVIQGTP
jgi:hypothetical protein